MNKTVFPANNWAPDRSEYGEGHLIVAKDVQPHINGYGPFPGASPVLTSGLPSGSLVSGYFLFDIGGLPFTVIGTTNAIYVRGQSEFELNKEGFAEASSWSFHLFGNRLFATNGVDFPQYADVGVDSLGTFQELTGAPKALGVGSMGDFLVFYNLSDAPSGMHWSALDDPLSWPDVGTIEAQNVQSDRQVFPSGGQIQSVQRGLNNSILVVQETAVKLGQYVGTPIIFQFTDLSDTVGAVSMGCVASTPNQIVFLSSDGFYACDGNSLTNISTGVLTQWFTDRRNEEKKEQITAVYYPRNNIVLWEFSDVYYMGSEKFSHLLIYHVVFNRWSVVELPHTILITDSSRGLTLEDLDQFGPLDTLPFSLDTAGVVARKTELAYFLSDGSQHMLTGGNREGVITTAYLSANRTTVFGIRPLIDVSASSSSSASSSLTGRQVYEGEERTYQYSKPSPFDGVSKGHRSVRYGRVSVTIPDGTPWSSISGVEIFFEEEGEV